MATGTSIVKGDAGGSIVPAGTPQVQRSLPDVPALAKAMGDVFKVGGWPLAALFVAALLLLFLIGKGLISQAVGFVQTVTIILTISSVVTLLVFTGIAYARWRTELNMRCEVYQSETKLQDKFILELTEYVLNMAKPGWGPADLKNTIEALSTSMVDFIQGVSTARQELRASVIIPPPNAAQVQ
jgi:hypothetical protein